ncbi:MAG TPA: ATP-binding protein [Thermoanaerobaculia bacterium]|nr:ATP-binding protein [Thermoanaerobaculia bacterium]
MQPPSGLRALVSRPVELLAGAFVAYCVLDLALDLSGDLGPVGHVVLAASWLAFALALVVAASRARRSETREREAAEAERRRLEERQRLGQRLEAVGRLAGGVAHDFNNQLTTILGYCDLLSMRLGRDHPLQHEVGEIRRAGRRSAALIDQLLSFSRRKRIAPRHLDLNEVVAEVSALLRPLLGRRVELVCRLASDPLPVEADSGQLEQLMVCLASNARDAMPDGGRLVLTTGCCRLDSSRSGDLFDVEPGEYCRLTMADSGEGMDAETLAHVFEPFYTTKEVGRGSGLGLACVYGMVKQNRGYIWVDSRPGAGATFDIYLPRVSSGAPRRSAADDSGERPAPPCASTPPRASARSVSRPWSGSSIS